MSLTYGVRLPVKPFEINGSRKLSILEHVEALPPDPIFGMGALAKGDKNPSKVDLTLGVYHNDALLTETMIRMQVSVK